MGTTLLPPKHRNFFDFVSFNPRYSQHFHIKSPAENSDARKNILCRRPAEYFKPKLGIMNAGNRQKLYQNIRHSGKRDAIERLFSSNFRLFKISKTDCDTKTFLKCRQNFSISEMGVALSASINIIYSP